MEKGMGHHPLSTRLLPRRAAGVLGESMDQPAQVQSCLCCHQVCGLEEFELSVPWFLPL